MESLIPWQWIETAIRIPTTTENSNLEFIQFIQALLKGSGLKIKLQKMREKGIDFYNLFAFNLSLNNRDLLVLHTHSDTVSGGEKKLWTETGNNPYRVTQVGDRLYGLGTADVKLDLLCKIRALQQSLPLERPISLITTYGEERGLIGAQKLFQIKGFKPKYALVGEPSELRVIYAHKGHLIVKGRVKRKKVKGASFKKEWQGVAAHSSTPHLGKNAFLVALQEIQKKKWGIDSIDAGTNINKVPDLCVARLTESENSNSEAILKVLQGLQAIEKSLQKKQDSRFSPNVATISINWVVTTPHFYEILFDVRLLPDSPVKSILKAIRPLFENLEITLDPPLKGKLTSRLVKTAVSITQELGIKGGAETKASSTEAAVYSEKGANAIVIGPGLSVGNVHRPNEYNSLLQLEKAVRFYTHMIHRL